MKRGHGSWLLLAGLLWANAASAQTKADPGSHVPIPPRPGQPDLEKVFEERFGRAMAIDDLTRILEKLYPERSRDELLRGLKNSNIDWNDPQLRKQLAELTKHPGLLKNSLTPEEIAKLQQQLQQKLPSLPVEPPTGNGPPFQPPMPMPITPPVGEPPTAEPPVVQQTGGEDAEEILRWLSHRLEGLAEKMDDSPALRRMFHDLGESLLANGMGGNGEGLDQQLGRWARQGRDAANWLEGITSPFGDIDLPRLNWGGTGGGNVGRMVPRVRDVKQVAGFWPVLAWIIVIGMALWAMWKLAAPQLGRLAEASGWRLGPWPVRPEAVSTRAELIQSFEYLSLLKFGQPAQCWNHRQIARQLDHESADRLAGLYEQARYAPDDEPLSSEQLAKARKDLAELAHGA